MNISHDNEPKSDSNSEEFHGFDEIELPDSVHPSVAHVDPDVDAHSDGVPATSSPPPELPSGVQTRRGPTKPVVRIVRKRRGRNNRNASPRSKAGVNISVEPHSTKPRNTPESDIYEFHEEETMAMQKFAAPVETPQETHSTPKSNEVTADKDESPKNGDEQPDEPKAEDSDKETDMTMAVVQMDAKTQIAEMGAEKQDKMKKKSRSKSKSKPEFKLRLNLRSKSLPVKRANRRAPYARNTTKDEPELDTDTAATDASAPDPICAARRLHHLHANMIKNFQGPTADLTQNKPMPISFVDIAAFADQSN